MREAALRSVFESIFGGPLIQNNFRALLVEHIVLTGLGAGWKHVGGWGSWDLEHHSGFRVEVKQSAARQSWVLSEGSKPSPPRFDIAIRKMIWSEATGTVQATGRAADCFVFAWHPIVDQSCDHREPRQWQFFVVPTEQLPGDKSISLKSLQRIAEDISVSELQLALQRLLPGQVQALL
jgi:hypothetical protein